MKTTKLSQLISDVERMQDILINICSKQGEEAVTTGLEVRRCLDISQHALFEARGEKILSSEYELSFDEDDVATCLKLREECLKYYDAHVDKYETIMYKEFIRYWSMPDDRGRPRWYKEKTKKGGVWHLPGRLATWAKSYKPVQKPLDVQQAIPDRLKIKVV